MFPVILPDVVLPALKVRCQKIPPGESAKGWICGPIVMAVVHWSGSASKPCAHAMSGGVLDCPCATTAQAKRKIGYVPMLTMTGEHIVCIVSNGVAAELIPKGQGYPLQLSRSKVKCAPLLWSEWPSWECGEDRTKKVQARNPVNIQPYLLHLWNHEALRSHFQRTDPAESKRPTDKPVTVEVPTAPPASTESTDKPLSPPSAKGRPKKWDHPEGASTKVPKPLRKRNTVV